MEKELGQPLIIEYKPGAGGSIAGAHVARAEPDGYTLLLATGSLLAINLNLYKDIGYDPVRDFAPISMLGMQTNVLYAHPSVKAKTLAELIALTKANPGKYNFGSGGVGTPAHLAGELLKIKSGADITHVPFRGTGPSLQAVIAGHVQMAFNPPPPLLEHIKAGTIHPIAVSTLKRTAALPDVPTIAESGYPGFEATTWHGLVAPAKTPKEIVEKLNRAFRAAIADPEIAKQLTGLGVDLHTTTPQEFGDYIKSEIPKWAEIIKAAGVKAK
jgi:tripartite-type tricarboxylate transporter receptor subunit TctC